MTNSEGQGAGRVSFWLIVFAAFIALCAIGFAGLGIWQVERLAWKNGLIAAVETRSTGAPVDLDSTDWDTLDPEASEYQRVRVTGQFANEDRLTQAVTALGGGFWVMTPLQLADGRSVLINRGFVSPQQRDAGIARPAGDVIITGLLRASEPDGGFLRSNDPAGGRWYSRDVAELGADLQLNQFAPFFVDADASAETPVGGLTVLSFPNNHLIYALTWFGLTGLCLFGLYLVLRDRWRR